MTTDFDSFTVLWTADQCERLVQSGDVGRPLSVIFGGEHQSTPSLTRFKVNPGDRVYPVRVSQRKLYIIGCLTVADIISIDNYLKQQLNLPRKYLKMHIWDLEEALLKEMPELGHRLPRGCVDEAAIGQGTPIRFDRSVSPDVLTQIRYQSTRGERPIKHVEDGQITHSTSIQGGVYRLSPESSRDFASLLLEC